MNPLVARTLKSTKPFRSYEQPKTEIEIHYLENGLYHHQMPIYHPQSPFITLDPLSPLLSPL